MKTPIQRVLGQLLLLMLPLIAFTIWGLGMSDSEDRELFAFISAMPFSGLFFSVLGGAIFSAIGAIYKRKFTGMQNVYWLGAAFVLTVWVGCNAWILY